MANDPDDERRTDGSEPGFDEAAVYRTVRRAVRDALLDVVGTLVLVVFALALVWLGMRLLLAGASLPSLLVGGLLLASGGGLGWWATVTCWSTSSGSEYL